MTQPDIKVQVHLTDWQHTFIEQFVSRPTKRSLLVAPPGTGKTSAAMTASQMLIQTGAIDSLMVISDRTIIRDHWREAGSRFGLALEKSINQYMESNGISATSKALEKSDLIDAAAASRRWLIIADDADDKNATDKLISRMLQSNSESRALFLSREPHADRSFDAQFHFEHETFLSRAIIDSTIAKETFVKYSPSVALLQRLRNRNISFEDLTWRQFEKLIASLLEGDGYTVELMLGSKDGGVDVVAIKDLGPSGYFKALWQAKKQSVGNKVGVSIVRELADTRQQLGANKAMIVTSSYLTRGALERIDREKFLLGKIDRSELQTWIDRTLASKRHDWSY